MSPETEQAAEAPVTGAETSPPETETREARLAALERELSRRDPEELRDLDPEIREMGDLLAMPEAEAFGDYVLRGLSLRDAYWLTHRQQMEQRAAEAGRRQALSALRSKEHLSALGPVRGSGAAAVPPEELRWFRALNPEAGDGEILAYYNKHRRD